MLVFGSEHRKHIAPFHFRRFFYDYILQQGEERIHDFQTAGSVCHLATAETDGYLYFISTCEEFLYILCLDFQVVLIDGSRKAHFLKGTGFLILLGLFEFLFLLKAILAIVHNAAYRGLCLGGNVYQVEVCLICQLLSLFHAHDTQLFAVCTDQSDFFVTDLFVDQQFVSYCRVLLFYRRIGRLPLMFRPHKKSAGKLPAQSMLKEK